MCTVPIIVRPQADTSFTARWYSEPDMAILHPGKLCLLTAEVVSDPKEVDKLRMLMSLIVHARLVRHYLKEAYRLAATRHGAENFCPLGLYATKDGIVNSYLAHCDDSNVRVRPLCLKYSSRRCRSLHQCRCFKETSI